MESGSVVTTNQWLAIVLAAFVVGAMIGATIIAVLSVPTGDFEEWDEDEIPLAPRSSIRVLHHQRPYDWMKDGDG